VVKKRAPGVMVAFRCPPRLLKRIERSRKLYAKVFGTLGWGSDRTGAILRALERGLPR
jgi:hypothetical protein